MAELNLTSPLFGLHPEWSSMRTVICSNCKQNLQLADSQNCHLFERLLCIHLHKQIPLILDGSQTADHKVGWSTT